MKKILLSLSVLTVLLLAVSASAQVSLTNFYDVYTSLDEVQFVMERGQIDGRIVQFLQDENQPTDQKAAVMNALTANNTTKSNALTFRQFIARKYGENWQELNTSKLSSEELFCLGYLTILDEEGAVQNGLLLLKQAVDKDPANFTIQMITALAGAQESLQNRNKCQAWQNVETVANDVSLSKNMNAAMEKAIIGAVEPYQEDCN